MFVRQNQQQFRNSNADVQIYYGPSNSNTTNYSWSKPVGVSHIYMMCIGAGGNGDGVSSGGSGAVTVWYGAAQNVPEVLNISIGTTSTVRAKFTGSTFTNLLNANKGVTPTGGAADSANQFTASGFFQSVAGQDGDNSSASATTFLSGGASGTKNANYGYGIATTGFGFFQMQPIIVGMGATGNVVGSDNFKGGVGCGGCVGSVSGGIGGPGMVLIASW